MIMVLLHSAYGNTESAQKHANQFPIRADMTSHKMNAYISHFNKDPRTESICCQYDFMYHFEAMLDDIVKLGCCYYDLGNYDDAQNTLNDALKLIDVICENEEVKPSMHFREQGDIYSLLAKFYLKDGKTDEAISILKLMVNHDLYECSKYKKNSRLHTPLLRDTDNIYYAVSTNINQRLINKLSSPAFNKLKENDAFLKLVNSAKNAAINAGADRISYLKKVEMKKTPKGRHSVRKLSPFGFCNQSD